ncbi:RNA-directed RNA polymerase [Exidia glandulosa HHB12029]|uniref:RNA-dependent RNA polymerase n=1 Tax=Exidia glandulosa HHB12029 TaxID=1314781 RepID=A0A165I2Z5_EXIGL|nr:RNA-directed RNA polymerase [Exidia glandulosa HHB12029]
MRLAVPAVGDSEWRFNIPNLVVPRGHGMFIVFKSDEILIRTGPFGRNRILHNDDPSKFISASFKEFRMPDYTTVDYLRKFFAAGLFLNGRQYRFYHHSNSQLRERSCFLREAENDAELDARIYRFGDFLEIKSVAKRAKRIGLLFSGSSIDYELRPELTEDIDDLMVGNENFSDGCGLISRRLADQLSKQKKIIFRGLRYTPSVFQIRYRGYKGVLMLHPDLDAARGKLAQFRKSMKKFNATLDNTLSVVGYSAPYAFGRLNNDIIVLISSLGITTEALLAKQAEYFQWLESASHDVTAAVDIVCSLGAYALAERILLEGLDSAPVRSAISAVVTREVKSFRKDTEKARSRMIVRKSRRLFGVCDPFRVLREGEVHVRISEGRQRATTLTHCDVIVVKNPCLHPGDVIKLRTVDHPKLRHLVDCVVFASVGKRAAASMTSGGDLDGDDFFVCWDHDIVPKKITDSYAYPPGNERINGNITRMDLAAHFASYSGASVAKVSRLHDKWARYSPQGALCSQCLELNALHSLAVDGGRIKVPTRLSEIPEAKEPYVVDELAKAAEAFAERFLQATSVSSLAMATDEGDAAELISNMLGSKQHVLPEWDLVQRCLTLARLRRIDFSVFLPHIDYGSLGAQEKYALVGALPPLSPLEFSRMWNSLFQSDVLRQQDLEDRNLDRPLSLQQFYSSRVQGRAAFFEYLSMATRDFTRKMLVLKIDDRIAVGIFIKGAIAWEYIPVEDEVVVCTFEFRSSRVMSTYRQCAPGFRIHCRDGLLRLYEKNIANTFVFVSRPAPNSGQDIIASIALQKFSSRVQQQIGRLRRTPVVDLEIHVVSNRDRVAQQAFDLRFEHVQTEEVIREVREPRRYELSTLMHFDWATRPSFKEVFAADKATVASLLSARTSEDVHELLGFAIRHRAHDHVFWIFECLLTRVPEQVDNIIHWIDRRPDLAFVVLKKFPPDDENSQQRLHPLALTLARGVILCANSFGIASLVALEKLHVQIRSLDLVEYCDVVYLAAHCVLTADLVREVLLVLHEQRGETTIYAEQQILAIACDRAEEALDTCPTNDQGHIRRGVKGIRTRLTSPSDAVDAKTVKADVRVDRPNSIRLHSHVRLQAASAAEGPHVDRPILSGVVIEASRGEIKIRVFEPLPPEFADMDWDIYDASSVATTNAMLDAVKRLADEGHRSCALSDIITGVEAPNLPPEPMATAWEDDALNESQLSAVNSVDAPLALIWGPPGMFHNDVM